MLDLFLWVCLFFYAAASIALMVYGLNAYVLLSLFLRRIGPTRRAQAAREKAAAAGEKALSDGEHPLITTQIPLYNEFNVAERIIRAVAAFDYPQGRHQIQVVDDSTDETREVVDRLVAELSERGIWIEAARRPTREGYKAGALDEAMDTAEGTYLAIFDSDFVPQADFLKRMMPHFHHDRVALVQARWGHLNAETSPMTMAQSIGIDGHFVVEQVARSEGDLFLNFNGTAGIWRREAIADGGGWQADTLTEDLDLSYRCQMRGWELEYVIDVVVPAELPETYAGFKQQQFRWAKGSTQTARKLLSRVMRSDASKHAKWQAIFHLLHYCVHLMMLTLVVFSIPMSFLLPQLKILSGSALFLTPLIVAACGPSILYFVSQRFLYPQKWKSRLLWLPALIALGFGMCLSNTRAILEAVRGKKSGFVRTPKKGATEAVRYQIKKDWLPAAEIIAGFYCIAAMASLAYQNEWGGLLFFLCYSIGFFTIGLCSWQEQTA